MASVIPIVASVSLLCVLPVLIRLRRLVRGTTLTDAWCWMIACWGIWELAWIANWLSPAASLQDQIWYAAAVFGLCPPIAVLGAKRPGSRVWAAFVVAPLVLVFAWPALTLWVHQVPPARLQLETPMLLGYGLVLVMGFGNYLGTRNSLPAVLSASASGWLAWQLANPPEPAQSLQPIGPTILLIAATLSPLVLRRAPIEDDIPWNRVWREYRQAFGVVWAKRLMDRLNHAAQTEHWPARWENEGLVWQADATEAQKEETLRRVDHTFHWLLRRFVDPEWIEARQLEPR